VGTRNWSTPTEAVVKGKIAGEGGEGNRCYLEEKEKGVGSSWKGPARGSRPDTLEGKFFFRAGDRGIGKTSTGGSGPASPKGTRTNNLRQGVNPGGGKEEEERAGHGNTVGLETLFRRQRGRRIWPVGAEGSAGPPAVFISEGITREVCHQKEDWFRTIKRGRGAVRRKSPVGHGETYLGSATVKHTGRSPQYCLSKTKREEKKWCRNAGDATAGSRQIKDDHGEES